MSYQDSDAALGCGEVREDLSEEVTLEEVGEGARGRSGETVIQAEGTARAKALGQEFTWHIQEAAGRPVWLEQRE